MRLPAVRELFCRSFEIGYSIHEQKALFYQRRKRSLVCAKCDEALRPALSRARQTNVTQTQGASWERADGGLVRRAARAVAPQRPACRRAHARYA